MEQEQKIQVHIPLPPYPEYSGPKEPKPEEEALTHFNPKTGDFLTVPEERFCQLYIRNFDKVHAYIQANGLESETTKNFNWFMRKADELLRKPEINRRIRGLLDSLHLNDETVDLELAHVICQNAELSNKVRGIDLYNKIKGRYDNTVVHKFSNVSDDDLQRQLESRLALLTGPGNESGSPDEDQTDASGEETGDIGDNGGA